MKLLDKIGHLFSFGKSNNMAENEEFVPTNILKHRYQDPKVLVNYVKTLSPSFTDDKIQVKKLRTGQLGLKLPRKLDQEELDGAIQAFIQADIERKKDDGD